MTFNVSGLATGALCLIGLVVATHAFMRWLYANIRRPECDGQPPKRWSPRWTVGVIGSVVLMFASGIGIVGIVHQTGWLLTSKQRLFTYSMEAAYRSQSNNNLKQVGLGLLTYHDVNRAFPAGATFDQGGWPQHGWQTYLLPFVEQKPLYDRLDRSLPWDAPENHWAFSQHPPVYMHPKLGPLRDKNGYGLSGYAGNAYLLGGSRKWTRDRITDGAAKTILCGEATFQPRPWGDPVNWRDPAAGIGQMPNSFGGPLANVTQFVFADGHTHAISNKIDPAVLRALCTPSANDAIPLSQDD